MDFSLHVLLFGIIILLHGVQCEKVPKANKKEGKQVSPVYVYKKLRQLEKKHAVTLELLGKAVERIDRLTTDVDRLLDDQKAFSDDPACPNGVPGFYLSTNGKSCYGVQPMSVMVNWTMATSICYSIDPDAHLVALETPREQEFVTKRWRNQIGVGGYSRFWTSGYMTERLNWQWTHSKRSIKHPNWIPTTTHDDDRFLCLSVLSNEGFRWADSACWAPHMVMCEIELMKESP